MKWIESRRSSDRPMQCEVCHTTYAVAVSRRLVCDTSHACSLEAVGHLSEAFVMLFCLGCMITMLSLVLPTLMKAGIAEKAFVGLLFLLTMVLALSALKKVLCRWREVSSRTVIQ